MTGSNYYPGQYQGPFPTPPPVREPPQHLTLIIVLAVVGSLALFVTLAALGLLLTKQAGVSSATAAPKPSTVDQTPSPSQTPDLKVTTVTATFSLVDQDTADNDCEGEGGYGDIDTGASVTIEDQKGETVGSTTLDVGTADDDTCTWQLTFDEVPMDHTQYTLKIGDRGGLTHSRHVMETDDWHFDAEIS